MVAGDLENICLYEQCMTIFLGQAGQRFRDVLSQDEHDVRALNNWGRVLCVRASLTSSTQAGLPRRVADNLVLCTVFDVISSLLWGTGVNSLAYGLALWPAAVALPCTKRANEDSHLERIQAHGSVHNTLHIALRNAIVCDGPELQEQVQEEKGLCETAKALCSCFAAVL